MTKKTDNQVYSGHYTIVKRKQNSEESVIIADFENLITTFGISLDASGGFHRTTYCALGTGTTAPVSSNLQLEQPLMDANGQIVWSWMGWNATPVGIQTVTLPYEYKISAVANFIPGLVYGNLTEIGLYQADPQSGEMKLFSRALIKDSNGNPTTLTVAQDEYLDVYYYLKTSFSPINVPFTMAINGSAVTGRVRSILDKEWGLFDQSKQQLFSAPTHLVLCMGKVNYSDIPGTWGNLTQVYGNGYGVTGTHITGNKFVDMGITLLPADGAFSFETIVFGNNPVYVYEFDQVITKSASESLTIGFRYNWDKV
jgi:hypothetical protein